MRWVDPSGLILVDVEVSPHQQDAGSDLTLDKTQYTVEDCGCVLTAVVRIAETISGEEIAFERADRVSSDLELYGEGGTLTPEAQAALIGALTGEEISVASVEGSYLEMATAILQADQSEREFYATARINTTNAGRTSEYKHTVNINEAASPLDVVSANDPSQVLFQIPSGQQSRQPIVDTSNVGRQTLGYSAGRINELLRVDFFYVIPGDEQ